MILWPWTDIIHKTGENTTMANNSFIKEDITETLQQIASLCPMRKDKIQLSENSDGHSSNGHYCCTVLDFEIGEDKLGGGHYFSCRNSRQGTCAGYINNKDCPAYTTDQDVMQVS